MATIKITASKGGTGNLENYLKKESKTEEKLITGHDCDSSKFAKSFELTRNLNNQTAGREHYHIVQSFAKGETTAEQAHEIGNKLAKSENFKGFQAVVITHKDKEHIHNHIVINSVSFETGKKYVSNAKSLYKIRDFSDNLCREYGLKVVEKKLEKEVRTFDFNKQKVFEKANEGKVKSYVIETKTAVDKALETATNKKEFIEQMEGQGYSVKWNDKLKPNGELENKNITFENEKGEKVRLSNLQKTFSDEKYSREGLVKEFDLVKTPKIAIEPLQTEKQTELQKNTSKELVGDFKQSEGQIKSILDLKKEKTEILTKLEQGEKLVKIHKDLESAKESFKEKLKNLEIPEKYSLFDKVSGKAKELEKNRSERISEIKKDIENIELKQTKIENQVDSIGSKKAFEKELKELEEKIKVMEQAEIEKKKAIEQKKIQEIEENRTEKTSKKIEFHNEITGRTVFVESKTFENGEMETRSSAAAEPFKQPIGEFIKYKDLQAATMDLVKNNFVAVNKITKTEKGIEKEKLDQEFNKKLREKIQDLEKQKKPERDFGFSR